MPAARAIYPSVACHRCPWLGAFRRARFLGAVQGRRLISSRAPARLPAYATDVPLFPSLSPWRLVSYGFGSSLRLPKIPSSASQIFMTTSTTLRIFSPALRRFG